uniref:Ribosomal protein S8 n=1 Tax=Goniomonas avonlea TaxID=1255295 RepID=A0A348G6N0_9CRYP|nr:ribosomal protein S8 [Goniomonas avonlea]
MNSTDPISSMFAQIQNGQKAKLFSVLVPVSKSKLAILDAFYFHGYIQGYRLISAQNTMHVRSRLHNTNNYIFCKGQIEIFLKYSNVTGVIDKIVRISSPGQRVFYCNKKKYNLEHEFKTSFFSTSFGILPGYMCNSRNLGGEFLCVIY